MAVPFNVEVNPEQIVAGVAVADTPVGLAATVRATLPVFTQPLPSVPVTVMVVAVVGLAVIGLPEAAERPGVPVPAQVYVLAPLAVSVMAVPPGVQ